MSVTDAFSKYSLEEPILFIKDLWMNKIFPAGTSNKKKIAFLTLGATVALVCRTVYRIYHVPRSLRHIPSVNYFHLIRSILRREDATTRTRTVFAPAMKKGNGVYLVR
jgi:hypothetical protein